MKTVLEYLNGMEDKEARELALNNLDERYKDEIVFTLNYALMLAVWQDKEEEKVFWRKYRADNSTANRYSNFYHLQTIQQETKK